jgi:threonyl-tRNA synthetase
MGSDEVWDKAEGALASALEGLAIPYIINPGDGAFYGPKIDIQFVDAINRPWQLGTLQCDFNLPQAFDLTYIGEDNREHRPVMLHRAILGSLERFIGVFLEHTAGSLPAWLAPVQVQILSITDRVNDFCDEIQATLKNQKVRVDFDKRNEKLSRKILDAQMMKVPFMIVVGDKEAENGTVSVRLSNGKQINAVPVEKLTTWIVKQIQDRVLEVQPNLEVSH